MNPVAYFRSLTSRLLHRSQTEREIEAELSSHIQSRADDLERSGLDRAAAERRARIEFGSGERFKEECREATGGASFESFLRDLRFGMRMLVKNPAFTIMAVATLALGVGANTAVFSAFNSLLLRPLPFEAPDQLVRIYSTKNGAPVQVTGNPGGPSQLDARDFAQNNHTFEKIVPYDTWRKNVSYNSGAEPEQMRVGLVPGGYFEILRIRPLLGRLFSEEENQFGRHYVAAIDRRLWQERYAGSTAILGQKIFINDESYTIVAVMPEAIPEWMEPGRPGKVEIWTPFASTNAWAETSRGSRGDAALGRLKPGVTLQQAQADLSAVAAQLAATYPIDQDIGVTLTRLADTRAGTLRPMLFLLGGAVSLILLIACLNLANLLLARNAGRAQELAMRAALGAGRSSLIRQLLIEAGLISLIGAGVGLGVAKIAVSSFREMYSSNLPQLVSIEIDWRVVTFTLLLSVATALFFGLAPAIKATRVNLIDVLKQGGRTGTASRSTQGIRRLLVVTEMAMSLMLILVASLLIQSLARLERQSLGIQPEQLIKAHFYMPPARYPNPEAITRFSDNFVARVRALPGVTAASITTVYPPNNGWGQMLDLPGHPVSRIQDVAVAEFGVTDPHFLTTLGIPLVRGRDFGESDTANTQPVALINQEFSRRYFSNQDPIGRQVHIGPPPFLQLDPGGESTMDNADVTIVGVIGDFRNRGLVETPQPQIIGLYSQHPLVNYGFKDIVVRTAANPASIAREMANQLHGLDGDIPLAEVQTFDELVKRQVGDRRFTTFLLSSFAITGLILAVVGIYGVVSIVVTQRQQELAVRIALGASRASAVALVLRQSLQTAVIGAGIGLLGAWAAQRLLSGFLFQVSPVDPITFGGGALFLLVVAALASLVPAARALRIEPSQLLRRE
jgi:putative ABC transport system permease protein